MAEDKKAREPSLSEAFLSALTPSTKDMLSELKKIDLPSRLAANIDEANKYDLIREPHISIDKRGVFGDD